MTWHPPRPGTRVTHPGYGPGTLWCTMSTMGDDGLIEDVAWVNFDTEPPYHLRTNGRIGDPMQVPARQLTTPAEPGTFPDTSRRLLEALTEAITGDLTGADHQAATLILSATTTDDVLDILTGALKRHATQRPEKPTMP